MKTRNLFPYRAMAIVILVAWLMPQTAATLYGQSSQNVLLYDGFDDPPLNAGLWYFHTLVGGSYTISNGMLIISSGTVEEDGGTVDSKQLFTPGQEMLTLETRIRLSASDGGFWGFWGDNRDGIVAFSVGQQGDLGAGVRPDNTSDGSGITIPNVDVRAWHTYRIEIAGSTARFYVDGLLKAVFTENVPQDRPMYVRLDRVSRGQDQTTSVDYVELRSGGLLLLPLVLKNYLPGSEPPPPVTGWQEVGTGSATGTGVSNNDGNSWDPSLAIAPDGTPYIAWEDDSDGDWEIYVRHWNGAGWKEVGAGSASGGGVSHNSADSRGPSLAIGSDGTPYVAWGDLSDGDYEVYVRCWTGTSWEEVGTGSAGGGGISDNGGGSGQPSLAVAPDGTPYIAWEDWSDGDGEIYVRRWRGGSWEGVGAGSASGGGISNNSRRSERPSLAIAPDGTPYVAWEDWSDGDSEIYVRRWTGSSWAVVGTGSASGGGISDNGTLSNSPTMAITQDGMPYVVWFDDNSGDFEIYVRRWNVSWEEVGAGSASGGGISDNTSWSEYPSVAIASGGMPYVAWTDMDGQNYEIYVRRWTGTSWEEVGAGSASGGGISNNHDKSKSASVAIAPDGTPYVAWYDESGGSAEIYIRRWVE